MTGITSTAPSFNGKVGDVIKITPNVTPVDATNKQLSVKLETSGIINSSVSSVASGNQVTFTAQAKGTTNIVFTAQDGSDVSLKIPVNITTA